MLVRSLDVNPALLTKWMTNLNCTGIISKKNDPMHQQLLTLKACLVPGCAGGCNSFAHKEAQWAPTFV